jgi:multidrug efflux pump subunit AcrB
MSEPMRDGREGGHHSAGRVDQRRRGNALHQSSSTNSGVSTIEITFQTGYNLDVAAVDVQNRVASVQGRLPAARSDHRHQLTKVNYNFVFGAGFYTLDGRYSNEFISNYLDVYVTDALKRVPGVGDVMIFGERKYAMRVWLDPIRLAARGLTATDVVNALMEQNVEVPAGAARAAAFRSEAGFQIPVRVVGRLTDPDRVRQHHCEEHVQRAGASERRWARGQSAPRITALRWSSWDILERASASAALERQRDRRGPES